MKKLVVHFVLISTLCLGILTEAGQAQKLELVVKSGHSNMVKVIAFSPDGKLLASTGLDNAIKLWDVQSGQEIKTLGNHRGNIGHLIFSADGKILLSATNQIVKIWDVQSGQEIKTFQLNSKGGAWTLALSPDKKIIAYSYSSKERIFLKLLDTNSGQEIKTLSENIEDIEQTVFSPDGKNLVTLNHDKIIKLWDVQSGRELKAWSVPSISEFSPLVFSPDGKMLATGSFEGVVRIWDVKSGQEVKILTGSGESHEPLEFSSDNKVLTTLDDQRENYSAVKFWDVATGKEINSVEEIGGNHKRP